MARDPGRYAWRVVTVVVVAAQVALIIVAYGAPVSPFGYQMFPEASEWRAEIVRVDADGTRRDIGDGTWEYDWSELVPGDGLAHPATRSAASRGTAATLDLLAEALDWVAANTPDDDRTAYLEAAVTVWRNDDPPTRHVLRSAMRAPERER